MSALRRHRLAAHAVGSRSRRARRTFTLEGLEERVVLSPTPYLVTSTADNNAPGTLRYEIEQANNQAGTAPNPEGSIITIDSTLSGDTILLNSTYGTLDLSETDGPEVIDGPSGGVTISGGNAIQVFNVANNVTATISGATITGGTAFSGGGVYNDGTLTLDDCSITGNTASNYGGGLYNLYALTLNDCTISGNRADNLGGGLLNFGTTTIDDSSLTSNASYLGGGAFDDEGGTLTVTDSLLAANSASSGGGVYTIPGSTLALISCTLSGNIADDAGGGLYTTYDATVTVTSCTIAGNTANGYGGGLFAYAGDAGPVVVNLTDTIIADNVDFVGPDDIAGSGASGVTGSYNLIGTGGSGGISNGVDNNIVLTSLATLGLAPLGSYGGPTETMALLPGSAAIGTGTQADDPSDNPITTDQRGFGLDTPNPDIGAFQAQPAIVVNTTDDGAGVPSGDMSLRQAVNLADVLGGDQTVTFDPTVFGLPQTITLTDGPLDLTDTTGAITIDGPAATLTVNGGNAGSVFAVAPGANLSLTGLNLAGTGGNGIVDQGSLTLQGDRLTGFSLGVQVACCASATVIGSTLSDNGVGLTVVGASSATVTNTVVAGNAVGIVVGSSSSDTSTLTANDDDFADDGSGVTTSQAGGLVDATDDWWGSEYGPASASNPGGAGSPASSHVTVTPWIGAYGETPALPLPGFYPTDITYYAVPTQLVITTQPSSTVTNGEPFPQQPVVEAEDANGDLGINFDSTRVSGSQVSLTLNPQDDASGTLQGTDPLNATDGIATFSDLGILGAGTFTLNASALPDAWSGLATDTSDDITVQQATPTFSDLSASTSVTYGTASLTVSGDLTSPTAIPVGATVTVTIDGFTADGTVGADGSFTATIPTATVPASATPYTIDYAFAGNTDFAATSDDSTTLTVNPVVLTVTLTGSVTKVYDGTTNAPLSAGNYVLGGVVPTDDVALNDPASGTYSTKNVGSGITVTASGLALSGTDAGNYTLASTTASAPVGAITPAPLTITAGNATMVAGTPVPSLSATYTGFVGGDSANSLTTPAVLTTTANSVSPAGVYPIMVSGATSPNYTISFVSGTMSVIQTTSTTTLAIATSPTVFGQTESLTAQVAPSDPGGPMPAGYVMFSVDGMSIGMAGLNASGLATLNAPGTALGSHMVTAIYMGDLTYTGSPSLPASWQVNPASTTASLVASAVRKHGRTVSVILTANVDVVSPGSGSPNGNVTIFRGNGKLASFAPLIDGHAAVKLSAKYAMGKKFWVQYSGENPFLASNSPTVPVNRHSLATTAARPLAAQVRHAPGPDADLARTSATVLSRVLGSLVQGDHKNGR